MTVLGGQYRHFKALREVLVVGVGFEPTTFWL